LCAACGFFQLAGFRPASPDSDGDFTLYEKVKEQALATEARRWRWQICKSGGVALLP